MRTAERERETSWGGRAGGQRRKGAMCKYNETLRVTPFQISESPNKYLRKGNLLYPIENANINMPILEAVSPMRIQFSKAPSALIQLSDLSYLQVVYVHPMHQCKMPRPMESVKQIHDYGPINFRAGYTTE